MPVTIQGYIDSVAPGKWTNAKWGFMPPIPPPVEPKINLLSATPLTHVKLRLTFDKPPAGDIENPVNYLITPTGAGHSISIVSAKLGTPAGGDTYPKTIILTHTEGTDSAGYQVIVSGLTGASGEALDTSSALFAGIGVQPYVYMASGKGTQIEIVMNEVIDPATIGHAGDYTVTSLGNGASVTPTAVSATGDRIYLTVTPNMTPLQPYRVTVPATITDTAGNGIDPARRSYDFGINAEIEYPKLIDVFACDLQGVPLLGYKPFQLYHDLTNPMTHLADLLLIAILTDRVALADDTIPDGTTNRRGWWADAYNDDRAKLGSKLWLLSRAPVHAETAGRAKGYISESLDNLVQEGIISRYEILIQITGEGQEKRLEVLVTAIKGDGTGVQLRFPEVWEEFEV